jgi:hypothetical protein
MYSIYFMGSCNRFQVSGVRKKQVSSVRGLNDNKETFE